MPALAGCLRALERALSTASAELIVVDNASNDDSVDQAVGLFPGTRTVANERNLGFAAACTLGAKSAGGEFLLFVNPDVQIDRGAVEQLVTVAERDDQAGLVSARLRFPDGSFQATCRRFPTMTNIVFSRGFALAGLFAGNRSESARYTLPDYSEITEVPAVSATLVMIRKSLYDRVGGFDERFFVFMEDTDLSLRLNQSGYVNLFVPSAGGIHDWGTGAGTSRLRRLWYHHRSVWKYFLKNFPNGFSVILLPLFLVCNFLLRLVVSGREGRCRVG